MTLWIHEFIDSSDDQTYSELVNIDFLLFESDEEDLILTSILAKHYRENVH
jgi:hypothetical protein